MLSHMLEQWIVRDQSFFEEAVNNIEHTFVYGILPEIIRKWTHTPVSNSAGVVQVLPVDHEAEGDNKALHLPPIPEMGRPGATGKVNRKAKSHGEANERI